MLRDKNKAENLRLILGCHMQVLQILFAAYAVIYCPATTDDNDS